MRKIKIRTPKQLKLPRNTPVVIVPNMTTYCIKQLAAQDEERRQQFWEDVWDGLRRIGSANEND